MGSFTRKYREKGFRQEAVIKEGWSLVLGSFIRKYGEIGLKKKKKSCHERGMVIGHGFIYKEIWRDRFQKEKKAVTKGGWSLVVDSFTRKYGEKGFREEKKNSHKKGMVFDHRFHSTKDSI